MTERPIDRDADRDFELVLEDFERNQGLAHGKPTERAPLIRQNPAPDPGPQPDYQTPQEEEDFAAALAAFEQDRGNSRPTAPAKAPSPGDSVRGRLLSIGLETAFVELGGKAEAIVRTLDLADADGVLLFKVGDPIDAKVVGPDSSTGALLLRPQGPGVQARANPLEVLSPGDLVEGTVTGTNKGGAEVDLRGRRAFCPVSHLADRYVEDAAEFVGRKLQFRVQRYEEGRGRSPNIVLSRRMLLEEEKAARADVVRAILEVGKVISGTVTAIEPYGAFIDLGGLEGLLHVSELSHRRVGHPSEELTIGQVLEVQITALEQGKNGRERISLSRKTLERDPWLDAMANFTVDSTFEGKVRRLESFGAFVELEPGIEGLIPISQLGNGRHLSHPREVLTSGQTVAVRVLSLDAPRRRIGLTPVEPAEVEIEEPSVKEALERHQAESQGFGAMAHFFEKGKGKK